MAVVLGRRNVAFLGNLTYTAGVFSSQLLADVFGAYDSISISAPAAVTGVHTVQILRDHSADETLAASYNDLGSPPGTAVLIAAGETIVIDSLAFASIALLSTLATSDVFTVYGHKATVIAG